MGTSQRSRTYWRSAVGTFIVVGLAAGGSVAPAAAEGAPWVADGQVLIPVGEGTARISIDTLKVDYLGQHGGDAWSAASLTNLGAPSRPIVGPTSVSWEFEKLNLSVVAAEEEGRLVVELTAGSDGEVSWPVTSDPDVQSVEFPNGEGMSIPTSDPFWLSESAGLMNSRWQFAGDLTMPFWGATFANRGVSYIVRDDIGTALNFSSSEASLQVYASHTFSEDRGTGTFEVSFAPTDGRMIAAAADYRHYLQGTGAFVALEEKIAANPETEKLIGAFHAYVWGDGRDPGIVARLQNLGIERAWLGYDSNGNPMDAATVDAAENAGYLVGPYDTWANAQDPEDADTESSVWPGDLWPNGCVIDEDGKPVTGFGGRGCYLSAAALDAAEGEYGAVTERVQDFVKNGASSYFLDVDAVGQLFRDYSPTHPQTESQDRDLRFARLQTLASGEFSDGHPLVVGSETAAAWANPVVSFSHGSSTPLADGIWALQKDKDAWGAWRPANRPAFFFQETSLPADLTKAMFDPEYRIPLYETVLHDSVISTDRWEIGLYKFPELVRERALTNMLYNTPAVIALDERVLDEHGEDLAGMQEFFGFLQAAAGSSPLTSFERLGESVQRTTFGDSDLVVTVNFGTDEESGIPAGCAVAIVSGEQRQYCP